MSYDEAIMKALNEIRKSGRKSLSFEAIKLRTNLDDVIINRRLKSLSKYGIIRPMGTIPVKYYVFSKKKRD